MSGNTYYCGYGFYHGFMETLLYTTGNVAEAREFCNFTEELTGLPSSWTACYHGIGHGAVDGADPTTWGNVEAMMVPGFELCEAVSETDFELYLCATGVYNAIEILASEPKYGLTHIQDDPFGLCATQPKEFAEPCYTNMVPAVLRLTKNDFSKAAEYVEDNMLNPEAETIDGYSVREMVILSLFHEFIRLNLENKDYALAGVKLCRALPQKSHLACIEGLSGGHMKYGEPKVEYVRALEFCGTVLLSEAEREACYKHMLVRLRVWYTSKQSSEICNLVDEKYRGYCSL